MADHTTPTAQTTVESTNATATSTSTAPVAAATNPARPKRPGFNESFWSADYAGGLGVLFGKLQQGVVENQQVLNIATMRAEAEEMYGDRLAQIAPTNDRVNGGFSRDDGASVRKAYEGVRGEMIDAAKNHRKIATRIRELVVIPFTRWCEAHALRVQNSQDDLMSKIKAHDGQAATVKKLRTQYFNKVRILEDAEEENKLAFPDAEKGKGKEPEKDSGKEKEILSSPVQSTSPTTPKIVMTEENPDNLPVELGDEIYTPEQIKKILTHMLETIALGDYKVPILGTYTNVSSGADIVEYLQKHMKASSVGYAEKIGQDMVDTGYLRLIGNVGSTFANSTKMKYQWRPRVWQITGVIDRKKPLARSNTTSSQENYFDPTTAVGSIAETLQTWNPLNNPYPNETPIERLRREAKESDDKYKAAVKRLDALRCNLEEAITDHLRFLERCEFDRLQAIKSVILDFSDAISNSIPLFQSQVDNMMLYQETIQPTSDLRYLLENYRTGGFIPRPVAYENYYGSVEGQTFGVDLEARARADRARVPVVVSAILSFLDSHYPDLEGDEARRSIWLADVPLAHTHHLRNQINHGGPIPRETLEKYDMAVVASVLKLYLLELPDSLVSSQVYEIIRTIYTTTADAVINPISPEAIDSTPRIQVLQSTLGQLRLNNIATLDRITAHLARLIDLTSADDSYVTSLATVLAPCILRPKTESALTMEEKHAYRLVRDLFDHREAIFGELKRQSSTLAAQQSVTARQRALSSTDENSRKLAVEARNKAISDRQREKSPAPSSRHRRDRSTEGSGGRFPVVVPSGAKRMSLDVPGSPGQAAQARTRELTRPDGSDGNTIGQPDTMPGTFATGGPGPHIPPPMDDDSPTANPETIHVPTFNPGPGAGDSSAYGYPDSQHNLIATAQEQDGINKSSSMKRSNIGSGARRVNRGVGSGRGRSSLGRSAELQQQNDPRGVELYEKPYDDEFA